MSQKWRGRPAAAPLARALWSIDIREAVLGDKLADWSELGERPF